MLLPEPDFPTIAIFSPFLIEKFMLLSNGVKIPSIGFGTYKSGDDEETAKIIKNALNFFPDFYYRIFFSAALTYPDIMLAASFAS